MRANILTVCTVAALLIGGAVLAEDKSGLDGDGFVQKWLVLTPIRLAENESGSDALDKEQIKGEGKLKPKAGDKLKVGDNEFVWKEHTCAGHLLDFNALLGAETEDSVGYAVTYLVAPKELKNVKMKTGSDDQVKVYLNGKDVFKYNEARATELDQDTTDVTLLKGVNILVVKVVNEKMDWSFCVRFTDKADKPLMDLKSNTGE